MWSRFVFPLLLGILAGALVAYGQIIAGLLGPDFTQFRLWPETLPLVLLIASVALVVTVFQFPAAAHSILRSKERLFVIIFILSIHCGAVSVDILDPTEVTIAFFSLVLLLAVLGPERHEFVSTPLNWLNALLFLAVVLSLPFDFGPIAMLKALKVFFAFFLLVNFLHWGKQEQTAVNWLMITGLIFGLFAYVQLAAWVFTQVPLTLIDQSNLENMFESTPMGPLLRVPGMTLSYRSFAMLLAVTICLALARLLFDQTLSKGQRRLTVVSLVVMGPAVVATLAKDVLVGLGLVIPLLLVLHRPARLVWAGILVLIISFAGTLALVVLPENIDRFVSLTKEVPKAEKERIRLDREGVEWFLHGPYKVFGRGVGSGGRYTSHSKGWPAHNSIILVADELGFLGLTALLFIYAWVTWRVLVLNMIARAPPDVALARAFAASLIIILFGTQFEATYVDTFIWTFFALVEATALRIIPRYRLDGTRLPDTSRLPREHRS